MRLPAQNKTGKPKYGVESDRGLKSETDHEERFEPKSKAPPSWESAPNKAVLLCHLLWHFNNTTEFSCPDKIRVRAYLKHMELISVEEDNDNGEPYIKLTEKGHVMVHHLMSQPLPVATTTWAMPSPQDF